MLRHRATDINDIIQKSQNVKKLRACASSGYQATLLGGCGPKMRLGGVA